MTAANAYRAYTVQASGTSITGITSIKCKVNGQVTDLITDAMDAITAIFVDARAAEVTIEATDMSQFNTFSPGDVPTTPGLVITYQLRAEGRGPSGSTKITATFANAVVTDNEQDASTTGIGKNSITFRCCNPSGGSPVVWS